MKITVATRGMAHQKAWAQLMIAGLKKHGLLVQEIDASQPAQTDCVVTWGWRIGKRYHAAGHKVLIAERGYVGDREYWTSLGWGGLNGRAEFPRSDDDGLRWHSLFGHLVKPWKIGGEYALLCGQVPGDMSVEGMKLTPWYHQMCRELEARGQKVLFRQHPMDRGLREVPAQVSSDSLAFDLNKAAFCLTYNSNTGVEAVLAGVPTIAFDQGSMAYEVSSHSFDDELIRPCRNDWMHQLAFCQWSPAEIENGLAWDQAARVLSENGYSTIEGYRTFAGRDAPYSGRSFEDQRQAG